MSRSNAPTDARSLSGYRISAHHPFRRALKYVGFFLLSLVASYSAHEMGERRGIARSMQATGTQPLQEQIDGLQSENTRLSNRLEHMERTAELDQKAATEVARSLGDMEAKLLEMNEELSFYRAIVSSSKLAPGLHVQDFRVERADPGSGQEFSYHLVLTQIRSNNRVAAGAVDVVIEGKRSSKVGSLLLKDITPGGKIITFGFKYFQSVDGLFTLPPGFKPSSVKLRVRPTSDWLKGVDRTYRWNELISRGV
jgi:hypothetical protein